MFVGRELTSSNDGCLDFDLHVMAKSAFFCVKKGKTCLEPHPSICNVAVFDVFYEIGYYTFGKLHVRGRLDGLKRLSPACFGIV